MLHFNLIDKGNSSILLIIDVKLLRNVAKKINFLLNCKLNLLQRASLFVISNAQALALRYVYALGFALAKHWHIT